MTKTISTLTFAFAIAPFLGFAATANASTASTIDDSGVATISAMSGQIMEARPSGAKCKWVNGMLVCSF